MLMRKDEFGQQVCVDDDYLFSGPAAIRRGDAEERFATLVDAMPAVESPGDPDVIADHGVWPSGGGAEDVGSEEPPAPQTIAGAVVTIETERAGRQWRDAPPGPQRGRSAVVDDLRRPLRCDSAETSGRLMSDAIRAAWEIVTRRTAPHDPDYAMMAREVFVAVVRMRWRLENAQAALSMLADGLVDSLSAEGGGGDAKAF